MNVDLHSHSTVSDGLLSPTTVAQRAHTNGVDMWALTDHDEVGGLAEAEQVAIELGMQFIPGVEISVTWLNKTVHIVGLNIDYGHTELVDALRYVRSGRVQRSKDMAQALADLGIEGALEGAESLATNPELVSRTHFARFLINEGHCTSIQQVFDKYLGEGCPAYVPMQWARLENAIRWIHEAGGVAVIAHPGRYNFSPLQFDLLFETFKELGGEGIEVVTGSHSPDQYQEYARIAKRYDFEASCGSDFHGFVEGRMDLGELPALPSGLRPIWQRWL